MKRKCLWFAALVVMAVLGFTLAFYSQLPAQVPVHWNGAGEIDRYGPRSWLLAFSVIMAFVLFVWTLLPKISPAEFSVEPFAATYWQIGLMIICLLGYIQCVVVWGAYSPSMQMNRALFGGIAIMLGLLGNVMGKVRRNFWIGIRTPWTLASERVWYSTHRFAAKTMVVGALLSLAAIWIGLPLSVCLGLALAGPIIPAFYSLVIYKRLERSGKLEA